MPNQDLIDQIIEKVNIAEVISEYIPVLPDGSGFKSVCPFHHDTHPSMKISTSKKIFKCFSCGEGGNVIQFVQKYEKISFNEALAKLAKKIGIDYQYNQDPNYLAKKKLYDCLKESAEFYQFYLLNTDEGKDALFYLENRGINADLIEKFKIGLAPLHDDYLHQALDNKGIPIIDQVDSGVVKDASGKFVDTFKGRIMFPLCDLNGNFVGFSGRIYLKDDHGTKYMNSNENLVFHKSDVLYNYANALPDVRKTGDIYVFEGFMDVIAAARANVFNAVATMGTALTKQHTKALQQAANRIILCFDGDVAGIEATHKAARVLSDANIIPYAVSLPDGLDPDEYQLKHGSEALKNYLETNLVNVYEYMYNINKQNLIVNDVVSIQRFKDKVYDFLRFANDTIKEFYLKRLSDDLQISLDNLTKELNYVTNYKPTAEVQKPQVVAKPKKKAVPKRVYKALDIIVYHSLYDCEQFKTFFTEYIDKLLPIDFILYITIFTHIANAYIESSEKEIQIDKIQNDLVNEIEAYKLFESIINNDLIYNMENDKEFLDSLNTIEKYMKEVDASNKRDLASNDNTHVNEYVELIKSIKEL